MSAVTRQVVLLALLRGAVAGGSVFDAASDVISTRTEVTLVGSGSARVGGILADSRALPCGGEGPAQGRRTQDEQLHAAACVIDN